MLKMLRRLSLTSTLVLLGAGSALAQGSFILGADDWTDHGELGSAGAPGTGTTVTETESNDAYTTANAMVIGDDYTGSIDNGGADEDYVAFTATAGDVIVATTLPTGTLDDTQLTLYDTDGTTLLIFNDDISYPSDAMSQFTFPITATGTYFLKVGSFSDHQGTYTCELRIFSGPRVMVGWEYIQHALEAISAGVTRAGQDGSVAVLGSIDSTATQFDAGAAYHHAVPLAAVGSSLSGVVNFHDGSAAINTFFTDLANGAVNPQIIVIPGSGSSNDLTSAEGAALTANAAAIGSFLSSGGGLLAHGDESFTSPTISYGWLSTVFPGASWSGGDNDIGLTCQGHQSIPGVIDVQPGRSQIDHGGEGTFAGHGLDVFVSAPGPGIPGPWSGVTVPESEPNDDFTTADPIAVGDDYTGSIDAAGLDEDYCSFSVVMGDMVRFETVAGGTLSDTRIFLYDTDGTTLLDSDDDGGPGLFSLIEWTFAATGTYYLYVDSFGTNQGTYTLEVRTLSPGPDLDVVIGSIPSPWDYLANELAGVNGEPCLVGRGPLTPSSSWSMSLTDAAPSSTAFLVVGLSPLFANFKGGVLVPAVDLITPIPTNAAGEINLAGVLSPSAPSGASLWLQYWITDAAGPVGFSASNGLQLTTP